MQPMTFASVKPSAAALPAQWAHDIRNALAITSLHLETLERLSGSAGHRAASAAQAVMKRMTSLCNGSLAQPNAGHSPCRRAFDLMATIKDVAAILEPLLPPDFEIRLPAQARCMVIGDPGDLYRIIFNLVQNAIAVARQGSAMSFVALAIEHNDAAVTVRIRDDGPGLPKAVHAKLFRAHGTSSTGGHGMGLAIARELAERNGATLRLAESGNGAQFILELIAAPPLTLVAKTGSRAMLGVG